MQRYAKAFAWLNGKDKVELSDLKTVLPYLLWHKVQPSDKAITENAKWKNDRISFVEGLIEKIENEYTEALGNKDMTGAYALALQAIRTHKMYDKDLSNDDVRTVVRNALGKIGAVDKPYALHLAGHIASEYNTSLMKRVET